MRRGHAQPRLNSRTPSRRRVASMILIQSCTYPLGRLFECTTIAGLAPMARWSITWEESTDCRLGVGDTRWNSPSRSGRSSWRHLASGNLGPRNDAQHMLGASSYPFTNLNLIKPFIAHGKNPPFDWSQMLAHIKVPVRRSSCHRQRYSPIHTSPPAIRLKPRTASSHCSICSTLNSR